MAINRLSATAVRNKSNPGMYADGGGLYLRVAYDKRTGNTTKNWVFRYMLAGKAVARGLGSINDRTLEEAREVAREHRKTKLDRHHIPLRVDVPVDDAPVAPKVPSFARFRDLYQRQG